MRVEPVDARRVISRYVDVILNRLVGRRLVRRHHTRQFSCRISENVNIVAPGWIGRVGLPRLNDQTVGMDVDGIRGQHLVHHRVASVRIHRVGRRGRQAIDQPYAQMVAGIKLQPDAAVGSECLGARRAVVVLRLGSPAHFEDPRNRMAVAEGDGGRFSDGQKIQQMVGTGEYGRLSRLGSYRLSETAQQDERTKANEASQCNDEHASWMCRSLDNARSFRMVVSGCER